MPMRVSSVKPLPLTLRAIGAIGLTAISRQTSKYFCRKEVSHASCHISDWPLVCLLHK